MHSLGVAAWFKVKMAQLRWLGLGGVFAADPILLEPRSIR